MRIKVYAIILGIFITRAVGNAYIGSMYITPDGIIAHWSIIQGIDAERKRSGKVTKGMKDGIEEHVYRMLEIEFEWDRIKWMIDSVEKESVEVFISDVIYQNPVRREYLVGENPEPVCGDLHLYIINSALRLLEEKYGGISDSIKEFIEKHGWEWGGGMLMAKGPPPDSLYERRYRTAHFIVCYRDYVDTSYAMEIGNTLEENKTRVENLIGGKINPDEVISVYIDSLYKLKIGGDNVLGVTTSYRDSTGRMRAYIGINPNLQLDLAKGTAVHEYSHYVQLFGGGGYDYESLFLMESTSEWTVYKIYPNLSLLYDRLKGWPSVFQAPELSLTKPGNKLYLYYYSLWILLAYIEEHYGIGAIREIWRKCWAQSGVNDFNAMVSTLGGSESFKRVYQNFMIANYFKDYRGINPFLLPSVAAGEERTYSTYIDYTSDFYMDNFNLPYLATIYQNISPDWHDTTYVYIKVRRGELKSIEDGRIVVFVYDSLMRDTIYIDNIPGEGVEKRIKYFMGNDILFMFNNVNLNPQPYRITFGYRVSLVPVIKTYTLNKSLYHPGDTVEMEVEISDSVFRGGGRLVEADFSSMEGGEAVYEKESNNPRKVKIKYVIPRTTREGEYEVRIKAYDPAVVIEHLRNHIPNEVKVRVKVGRAPAIKKTEIKKRKANKIEYGFKSLVPVNSNEIDVVFSKPMDTLSVFNNVSLKPTVPVRMEFSQNLETLMILVTDTLHYLKYATEYILQIDTEARDTTGMYLDTNGDGQYDDTLRNMDLTPYKFTFLTDSARFHLEVSKDNMLKEEYGKEVNWNVQVFNDNPRAEVISVHIIPLLVPSYKRWKILTPLGEEIDPGEDMVISDSVGASSSYTFTIMTRDTCPCVECHDAEEPFTVDLVPFMEGVVPENTAYAQSRKYTIKDSMSIGIPKVVATIPEDGAVVSPSIRDITIIFDKTIDDNSNGTVRFTPDVGETSISVQGKEVKVTFDNSDSLRSCTHYVVSVSGFKDTCGMEMRNYAFGFDTRVDKFLSSHIEGPVTVAPGGQVMLKVFFQNLTSADETLYINSSIGEPWVVSPESGVVYLSPYSLYEYDVVVTSDGDKCHNTFRMLHVSVNLKSNECMGKIDLTYGISKKMGNDGDPDVADCRGRGECESSGNQICPDYGEHPDDNWSITEPVAVNLYDSVSFPVVGVLKGPNYLYARTFLTEIGIENRGVGIDGDSLVVFGTDVEPPKILFIPTGALNNTRYSPVVLRSALSRFVDEGGMIFTLTQPYSEQFDILPGDVEVEGWVEDMRCWVASYFSDTIPFVLYGLDRSYVFSDGHITHLPSEGKVFLYKPYSLHPILAFYPVGTGGVMIFTAYTEWSKYHHFSKTENERLIIRNSLYYLWSLQHDFPVQLIDTAQSENMVTVMLDDIPNVSNFAIIKTFNGNVIDTVFFPDVVPEDTVLQIMVPTVSLERKGGLHVLYAEIYAGNTLFKKMWAGVYGVKTSLKNTIVLPLSIAISTDSSVYSLRKAIPVYTYIYNNTDMPITVDYFHYADNTAILFKKVGRKISPGGEVDTFVYVPKSLNNIIRLTGSWINNSVPNVSFDLSNSSGAYLEVYHINKCEIDTQSIFPGGVTWYLKLNDTSPYDQISDTLLGFIYPYGKILDTMVTLHKESEVPFEVSFYDTINTDTAYIVFYFKNHPEVAFGKSYEVFRMSDIVRPELIGNWFVGLTKNVNYIVKANALNQNFYLKSIIVDTIGIKVASDSVLIQSDTGLINVELQFNLNNCTYSGPYTFATVLYAGADTLFRKDTIINVHKSVLLELLKRYIVNLGDTEIIFMKAKAYRNSYPYTIPLWLEIYDTLIDSALYVSDTFGIEVQDTTPVTFNKQVILPVSLINHRKNLELRAITLLNARDTVFAGLEIAKPRIDSVVLVYPPDKPFLPGDTLGFVFYLSPSWNVIEDSAVLYFAHNDAIFELPTVKEIVSRSYTGEIRNGDTLFMVLDTYHLHLNGWYHCPGGPVWAELKLKNYRASSIQVKWKYGFWGENMLDVVYAGNALDVRIAGHVNGEFVLIPNRWNKFIIEHPLMSKFPLITSYGYFRRPFTGERSPIREIVIDSAYNGEFTCLIDSFYVSNTEVDSFYSSAIFPFSGYVEINVPFAIVPARVNVSPPIISSQEDSVQLWVRNTGSLDTLTKVTCRVGGFVMETTNIFLPPLETKVIKFSPLPTIYPKNKIITTFPGISMSFREGTIDSVSVKTTNHVYYTGSEIDVNCFLGNNSSKFGTGKRWCILNAGKLVKDTFEYIISQDPDSNLGFQVSYFGLTRASGGLTIADTVSFYENRYYTGSFEWLKGGKGKNLTRRKLGTGEKKESVCRVDSNLVVGAFIREDTIQLISFEISNQECNSLDTWTIASLKLVGYSSLGDIAYYNGKVYISVPDSGIILMTSLNSDGSFQGDTSTWKIGGHPYGIDFYGSNLYVCNGNRVEIYANNGVLEDSIVDNAFVSPSDLCFYGGDLIIADPGSNKIFRYSNGVIDTLAYGSFTSVIVDSAGLIIAYDQVTDRLFASTYNDTFPVVWNYGDVGSGWCSVGGLHHESALFKAHTIDSANFEYGIYYAYGGNYGVIQANMSFDRGVFIYDSIDVDQGGGNIEGYFFYNAFWRRVENSKTNADWCKWYTVNLLTEYSPPDTGFKELYVSFILRRTYSEQHPSFKYFEADLEVPRLENFYSDTFLFTLEPLSSLDTTLIIPDNVFMSPGKYIVQLSEHDYGFYPIGLNAESDFVIVYREKGLHLDLPRRSIEGSQIPLVSTVWNMDTVMLEGKLEVGNKDGVIYVKDIDLPPDSVCVDTLWVVADTGYYYAVLKSDNVISDTVYTQNVPLDSLSIKVISDTLYSTGGNVQVKVKSSRAAGRVGFSYYLGKNWYDSRMYIDKTDTSRDVDIAVDHEASSIWIKLYTDSDTLSYYTNLPHRKTIGLRTDTIFSTAVPVFKLPLEIYNEDRVRIDYRLEMRVGVGYNDTLWDYVFEGSADTGQIKTVLLPVELNSPGYYVCNLTLMDSQNILDTSKIDIWYQPRVVCDTVILLGADTTGKVKLLFPLQVANPGIEVSYIISVDTAKYTGRKVLTSPVDTISYAFVPFYEEGHIKVGLKISDFGDSTPYLSMNKTLKVTPVFLRVSPERIAGSIQDTALVFPIVLRNAGTSIGEGMVTYEFFSDVVTRSFHLSTDSFYIDTISLHYPGNLPMGTYVINGWIDGKYPDKIYVDIYGPRIVLLPETNRRWYYTGDTVYFALKALLKNPFPSQIYASIERGKDTILHLYSLADNVEVSDGLGIIDTGKVGVWMKNVYIPDTGVIVKYPDDSTVQVSLLKLNKYGIVIDTIRENVELPDTYVVLVTLPEGARKLDSLKVGHFTLNDFLIDTPGISYNFLFDSASSVLYEAYLLPSMISIEINRYHLYGGDSLFTLIPDKERYRMGDTVTFLVFSEDSGNLTLMLWDSTSYSYHIPKGDTSFGIALPGFLVTSAYPVYYTFDAASFEKEDTLNLYVEGVDFSISEFRIIPDTIGFQDSFRIFMGVKCQYVGIDSLHIEFNVMKDDTLVRNMGNYILSPDTGFNFYDFDEVWMEEDSGVYTIEFKAMVDSIYGFRGRKWVYSKGIYHFAPYDTLIFSDECIAGKVVYVEFIHKNHLILADSLLLITPDGSTMEIEGHSINDTVREYEFVPQQAGRYSFKVVYFDAEENSKTSYPQNKWMNISVYPRAYSKIQKVVQDSTGLGFSWGAPLYEFYQDAGIGVYQFDYKDTFKIVYKGIPDNSELVGFKIYAREEVHPVKAGMWKSPLPLEPRIYIIVNGDTFSKEVNNLIPDWLTIKGVYSEVSDSLIVYVFGDVRVVLFGDGSINKGTWIKNEGRFYLSYGGNLLVRPILRRNIEKDYDLSHFVLIRKDSLSSPLHVVYSGRDTNVVDTLVTTEHTYLYALSTVYSSPYDSVATGYYQVVYDITPPRVDSTYLNIFHDTLTIGLRIKDYLSVHDTMLYMWSEDTMVYKKEADSISNDWYYYHVVKSGLDSILKVRFIFVDSMENVTYYPDTGWLSFVFSLVGEKSIGIKEFAKIDGNVFRKGLQLSAWSNVAGKILEINLFDVSGRKIYHKKIMLRKGYNNMYVPVKVPAGIYFWEMLYNNEKRKGKIIILK